MRKIKYAGCHSTKSHTERRITEITDEAIVFDTGETITFDHSQECCEWNYADFKQLDDLAKSYTFIGDISFEAIDDAGFKFGDSRRSFFVPCYSEQNGYYSSDVDIYWNGTPVLTVCAEGVPY